ncbi:MAG TPA: class I SAM-dependent methyltransferase [Verrucomicrobiae bacterium]|jgi:trans-aconitate methyltransferase|nr:class I SAM-dependent methyltransferase [Verrucomicrobiae bacterium]
MNFDRLAAHYHWLEKLFAGGLMQRCRTAFLARTKNCRRALLVGEGTGKFLVELLRCNPQIQITCVEHCKGMIKQTRQRLSAEKLDCARIQFRQMDALDWTPPSEKFDLVVTNFFLDCFRADQLQKLVPLLAESTTTEAVWLLADFREPERGWRRWRAKIILAMLYASFKLTTSLFANRLTPPDNFLTVAGFRLIDRRLLNFGFAHADFWQRNIS